MTPAQWQEWRLRNFGGPTIAAKALGVSYYYYLHLEDGTRQASRTLRMAAMALEQFGVEAMDYEGQELRRHEIKVPLLRVVAKREADRKRREKLTKEVREKRWRPPALGR